MSNLPKGSKVLVTGASGFIGSHVTEQLVAAGYTVRATSRSEQSLAWLVDFINKKYGSGKIETFVVTDLAGATAYDEAVKGVSGVIHLATIGSATEGFDNDPKKVITPVKAATLSILASAKKEPGVKALVLTSSSTAVNTPQPNEPYTVTEDLFNTAAVEQAWNDPQVDGFTVYGASKTEGEQAFWKEAKTGNYPFQLATVVPYGNFGPILKPGGESSSSTGSWPISLYKGDTGMIYYFPPGWFVNVVDTAKLHVAALTDPEANGRRVFAYGGPYNWTSILEIMKKLRPAHKLPSPPENEAVDKGTVLANVFSESLLKKHYGHGWTGLEETIKQNIATLQD